MATDRRPWRRSLRRSLVADFGPRAAAYGYDLEDLDVLRPWQPGAPLVVVASHCVASLIGRSDSSRQRSGALRHRRLGAVAGMGDDDRGVGEGGRFTTQHVSHPDGVAR